MESRRQVLRQSSVLHSARSVLRDLSGVTPTRGDAAR